MSINISNNAIEWRKYRKKLEKDLFKIRWHQSRSVQQIPRITRTQGSPVKVGVFAASRGSRRRAQLQTRAGVNSEWSTDSFGDPDAVHASAATPYRLPRLLDGEVANTKPKEYVYKQPLTASHFLLRKDPTTATPVPDCTSPELRIKPNSTKCRPITQSMQTHILYQTWPQGGAKMHRLLPRISKPGGVIVLTDSQSTEPKTPPQSEVEYHLLPTLPLRPSATKQPIHNATVQIENPDDHKRERKLSWQLSPYSNKNFDRQGLGPNQGPFSREMPVKCMPPTNWLRMKIQRPRVTITVAK